MRRIGFGNHRIARSDRCGEITAGDAVKSEWEIVRSKHRHRPERDVTGADVGLAIDDRHLPRLIANRFGSHPQLIDGPGQFDIRKPRGFGQTGLSMRDLHKLVAIGFDPRCKVL